MPVCRYIYQTEQQNITEHHYLQAVFFDAGQVQVNNLVFPLFLHHMCNPAALISLVPSRELFHGTLSLYLLFTDAECVFFKCFSLFIFQIKCENLHIIGIDRNTNDHEYHDRFLFYLPLPKSRWCTILASVHDRDSVIPFCLNFLKHYLRFAHTPAFMNIFLGRSGVLNFMWISPRTKYCRTRLSLLIHGPITVQVKGQVFCFDWTQDF